MFFLILAPFVIQIVFITFDEWLFHRKRGLPKWERIGHPIDTLSVIVCLLYSSFFTYNEQALKIYIVLAVCSCLLVTKDEFVHKHYCPAAEQWLHAILFINHPILLADILLIWMLGAGGNLPSWVPLSLLYDISFNYFLIGQTVFTAIFFLYQVIYWNFIWKDQKSTTNSITNSTKNG